MALLTRNSTYQAAQMVSETIGRHFANQLSRAAQNQTAELVLAPEPPAEHIEIILDTAFWSSLRHEEGQNTRISIAYLPPQQAKNPLLFSGNLPLKASVLSKLGPGVERPGIHLGVWHHHNELYIWGTTNSIPGLCMVVDVSEPGLLVIKHRRLDGYGKFANVAILKGDQIKIVDEQAAHLPSCPSVLSSLLRFNINPSADRSFNMMVQMAVSMRAHKKGGILLLVPAGSDSWQHSMVQPMPYAIKPAYTGLSELFQKAKTDQSKKKARQSIQREVDSLAGLTAIDGATVLNDKYELLAFGAKIGRRDGSEPVHQIVLTEPIIGNNATTIHPSLAGGTRHLAAAQFVHDQRDAIAMVASQDGRYTVFSWSDCDDMVHAHRIDTLLL